jgi:muramoyltetrapeptide carboxypeptidase LdcA involved in peptidoglycan recycling
MRFPAPLRPGDRIGVTAPSSGVDDRLRPRLDFAIGWLRGRGYAVVVGECLDGSSHVSAPKEARAAELTRMLLDPTIRAVVPPWGGETAVDLLDQLDWDALAAADPTWVVGFSDTTTWMLPLALRLGWASIHGTNLMDTPYLPPEGVRHWLDVAGATAPFTQRDTGFHRGEGWDRWEDDPTVDRYTLDTPGEWTVLGGGPVDATGRLVGGCIETSVAIAGTPYGDVAAMDAPEGTVVYLEASDQDAYSICRALHGLRYAGWFDRANAVLVGRTRAPDAETLTQHGAVRDALGMLGVPVVLDVDCGHVPPYLPLVNGALARVVVDGERREVTQQLV